jgi:threonine/homoserine efflux transporter RhtA
VLDPAGGGLDPVGVLWAGLAGVALAVYFTMAGSAESRVPPLVLAWAGMAVGAVALGIAAAVGVLPFHTSTAPVTLLDRQMSWVVPVASLALVAAALAYAAGIAASRLLGAKVASFAGLTEVLFAVLIAWALLGQAPGAWQPTSRKATVSSTRVSSSAAGRPGNMWVPPTTCRTRAGTPCPCSAAASSSPPNSHCLRASARRGALPRGLVCTGC